MIDIEAEFRKHLLGTTIQNTPTTDEPLTVEKLREAARLIGPPPVQVRTSRYVPVLGDAKLKREPITDDMRTMVDDIGPQKVPIGFFFDNPFTGNRCVVVNPVNLIKEGGE